MAKKKNTEHADIINDNFPIVAIGASAGGLEAVTELLKNLSPETGMAFVLIQHLDPTHESMLSTILSRVTKMQVVEAEHRLKMEPNHFYIIPPNKDMMIQDGMLMLNPRQPKPKVHMPIDKFFTSLADIHKDGSIGIVLSGNADDGTIGLKAIKLAGGITIAQDETARFQSMPKSAIAEGVVDLILSPGEIASQLERLSKFPQVIKKDDFTEPEEVDFDENLGKILQLLKKSTSVDFSHYKITTIRRRIERRMLLYKLDSLAAYYKHLKQFTNEVPVLYQDLLINVTCFFRDEQVVNYLKKTLFPSLVKNKLDKDSLRIWVPALPPLHAYLL